jgi:hypothetical protein
MWETLRNPIIGHMRVNYTMSWIFNDMKNTCNENFRPIGLLIANNMYVTGYIITSLMTLIS